MAKYRSPEWLLEKVQDRAHELYYRSAVSKLGVTRRAHVYCVGTAKSGTHSVADLFSDRLRTFHEADWKKTIRLVLDKAEGRVCDATLRRHLVRRDRQFALDIDSSQLNYFCLPELVQLFPDARFVLTIRDPYSWLDSIINHQLARGRPPRVWQHLRDFRFGGANTAHPPEERALEARGLYTLDGYLSYWHRHNRDVLKIVPESRRLVVRTDEITSRLDDIARFIGCPHGDLHRVAERSHSFKALKKHDVLEEIGPAYLARKIDDHCRELLREFFPDRLLALEVPRQTGLPGGSTARA